MRHGHEAGEVALGGRRVGIERPRVRAADGSGEMALSVYRHFADRDPLSRVVLERMLAGVSWWRYGRTGELVGTEVDKAARGVSKSAISRNLCTEITLNTSAEETAVCNLGSIVIDQHLTPSGKIDYGKLRETVRAPCRRSTT